MVFLVLPDMLRRPLWSNDKEYSDNVSFGTVGRGIVVVRGRTVERRQRRRAIDRLHMVNVCLFFVVVWFFVCCCVWVSWSCIVRKVMSVNICARFELYWMGQSIFPFSFNDKPTIFLFFSSFRVPQAKQTRTTQETDATLDSSQWQETMVAAAAEAATTMTTMTMFNRD